MEASAEAELRATDDATGRHRRDAEVEFARIVAFSDGVFAIAITLLVLPLTIPKQTQDVAAAIWNLDDDLFAYAVSFAVIGKFWLSHHRFYGALERFDNTLMGLNMLYLAWVVLIPFTSEMLGHFGDDSAATIAYAAVMAAASGTFVFQIAYAYRKGLMRPDADLPGHRYAGPVNFLFAGIFLLSIPVALVSTFVAQAMWLAVFLVGRRAAEWIASRSEPPPQEPHRPPGE
ncbi:MAG TPA: TMEM175 family protein [Solirubrobacterales bacterium]